MTELLFFDTDCFSAFLWVKQEHILLNLYPGRIVLPQEVFLELSNPSIPHLQSKVAALRSSGAITTQPILVNTEEYQLYHQIAVSPPKGRTIIGKGEAAALALAKVYGGIIASNNLKDISRYIERYQLKYLTTGGILVSALNAGLINEATGDQIWSKMLSKRRFLPTTSFFDYLKTVHP